MVGWKRSFWDILFQRKPGKLPSRKWQLKQFKEKVTPKDAVDKYLKEK